MSLKSMPLRKREYTAHLAYELCDTGEIRFAIMSGDNTHEWGFVHQTPRHVRALIRDLEEMLKFPLPKEPK